MLVLQLAEGEHQHKAQGPRSVTDAAFFIDIVLTGIKGHFLKIRHTSCLVLSFQTLKCM